MVADQFGFRQGVREKAAHRVPVQARDVVAIEESVLDQFPVGRHGSHAALAELKLAQAEEVEIPVQARQMPVDIHLALQLDPDEAVAHGGRDGNQAHVIRIELGKRLTPGDIAQPAVQAVGPLVVGAYQGAQLRLALILDQAHATVAAHVDKGADLTLAVAQGDQWQAQPVLHQGIAGFRNLGGVGQQQGAPPEQVLPLGFETFAVRIVGDRNAPGDGLGAGGVAGLASCELQHHRADFRMIHRLPFYLRNKTIE